MTAQPPHKVATKYARDVVAGRVVACEYVRLACQRHLDDLVSSKKRKFEYKFDPIKANKVVNFIQKLPHTKGKWGRLGTLIVLEPWQLFIVCSLFGWVYKKTGLRRYGRAYIEVPRKNGKSVLAAGIALYMFCADGEHSPEVYCGATKDEQAKEVFSPARRMCLKKPALVSYYGLDVRIDHIYKINDDAKFERLIGNPGDGGNASCAIVDEYHEHKKPNLIETMEDGNDTREQPLILIVTTAGDNMAGPCYEERGSVINILRGVVANDNTFGLIYTIDEDDKWDSVAALKKANPNYGVSILPGSKEKKLKSAIARVNKRGGYKTKHLNVWVGARDAFFDVDAWQRAARPELKLEDQKGRRCFVAYDGAETNDICALAILFPPDDTHENYMFFGKYYLPETQAEDEANPHLAAWAEADIIKLTEGNILDQDEVAFDIIGVTEFENEGDKINGLMDDFDVVELPYDPWKARQFAAKLTAQGVPMLEYRNILPNMSDPTRALDKLILAGKIEHNGCPMFTWMLGNVVCREDTRKNIQPNKERYENKIDGPVAAIMALARALAERGETVESVYEKLAREA